VSGFSILCSPARAANQSSQRNTKSSQHPMRQINYGQHSSSQSRQSSWTMRSAMQKTAQSCSMVCSPSEERINLNYAKRMQRRKVFTPSRQFWHSDHNNSNLKSQNICCLGELLSQAILEDDLTPEQLVFTQNEIPCI